MRWGRTASGLAILTKLKKEKKEGGEKEKKYGPPNGNSTGYPISYCIVPGFFLGLTFTGIV
jgi:hypothetical protein